MLYCFDLKPCQEVRFFSKRSRGQLQLFNHLALGSQLRCCLDQETSGQLYTKAIWNLVRRGLLGCLVLELLSTLPENSCAYFRDHGSIFDIHDMAVQNSHNRMMGNVFNLYQTFKSSFQYPLWVNATRVMIVAMVDIFSTIELLIVESSPWCGR